MNFSFLPKFLPYFNDGAIVTILVSIIVVFFGTILGVILALSKLSKYKLLRIISNVYVTVFRGTPMVLQIMIFFVAMKVDFLPTITIGILDIDLSRLFPGIVALSMNSGAYVAEVIRGGILSVPQGQKEAAYSLGLRPAQTMFSVILPQAMRNILPALGNEFITIIKDSSLLATIGIMELYNGGLTTGSTTYITLEPLIISGLYYLAMTMFASWLLGKIEKKVGRAYTR